MAVTPMNPVVPIPESLGDVTSEWLTAALRSSGRLGSLESVVVEDTQTIGEESGFASRVGRIRLTCDSPTQSLPASMVVKMAATSADDARSQMLARQSARECNFYSLIWRQAGVRTPTCYYVAHQSEPPLFILLLEDLAAARFGDAITGWTIHDARLVVDALAALHATWWDDPKLDRWDWLQPFGDGAEQLEKFAHRRGVFLEGYGQDVSSDLRRLTMGLGSGHAELIGRLCRSPRTLLQGDTHLDNIAFFDGVNGQPVLFDWQTVAKGVCAVDLASFLSSGSTEQRRMHERELIERYHERLAALGVNGYSLETLVSDYVVALLRWWIGTVNGLGSSHAAEWTGRQAQLARESVQRWNGLAGDHALLSLMELT